MFTLDTVDQVQGKLNSFNMVRLTIPSRLMQRSWTHGLQKVHIVVIECVLIVLCEPNVIYFNKGWGFNNKHIHSEQVPDTTRCLLSFNSYSYSGIIN